MTKGAYLVEASQKASMLVTIPEVAHMVETGNARYAGFQRMGHDVYELDEDVTINKAKAILNAYWS